MSSAWAIRTIPTSLEVGDKLVINPGSVGQPRDGDPRASYAIIENQRVELKRIDYPVEETVRSVQESNLPEPAKALLAEVFRTGGMAKPDSNHKNDDGNNVLAPSGQSLRKNNLTKFPRH